MTLNITQSYIDYQNWKHTVMPRHDAVLDYIKTIAILDGVKTIRIKYSAIVTDIATDITIINPFNKKETTIPAIWDTGATVSAIKRSVIDHLGLEQLQGTFPVVSGNGQYDCIAVVADVIVADNKFYNLAILELTESFKYDAVIGMDIISKGDFIITNKDNKTTFIFRYPSLGVEL